MRQYECLTREVLVRGKNESLVKTLLSLSVGDWEELQNLVLDHQHRVLTHSTLNFNRFEDSKYFGKRWKWLFQLMINMDFQKDLTCRRLNLQLSKSYFYDVNIHDLGLNAYVVLVMANPLSNIFWGDKIVTCPSLEFSFVLVQIMKSGPAAPWSRWRECSTAYTNTLTTTLLLYHRWSSNLHQQSFQRLMKFLTFLL